MDESYTFAAPTGRARLHSLRPILIGAVVAFVLGCALTFFVGRSVDWSARSAIPFWSGDAPASVAPAPAESSVTIPAAPPTAAEASQAVRRVEQVAEQQGGIDQRVAAMEQRLSRLDLQAQAAASNAARAEGLLIAFAARRSIERGASLGYLADQLQLRFGDALPNAVDAVLAAGEKPVTIDQLVARLDGLAPVLSHSSPREGLLSRIGRELGEMFVIRSEDTPSPLALDRLERARLFLESGRVEAAVSEVRNMPNAGEAAGWIADAERFARAQRGLELLETTAILEPRRMRDGAGQPVEQPSPAG